MNSGGGFRFSPTCYLSVDSSVWSLALCIWVSIKLNTYTFVIEDLEGMMIVKAVADSIVKAEPRIPRWLQRR